MPQSNKVPAALAGLQTISGVLTHEGETAYLLPRIAAGESATDRIRLVAGPHFWPEGLLAEHEWVRAEGVLADGILTVAALSSRPEA